MSEAEPRVGQLSSLGQLGLEAVFYLSHHAAPPSGWKQNADALLTEAGKPQGLVRFTFLQPMRRLVDAAANQQQQVQ